MTRAASALARAGLAIGLAHAGACGPETTSLAAVPPAPPTAVLEAPERLFPGSRLALNGGLFLTGDAGATTVRFEGRAGQGPGPFAWPTAEVSPGRITLAVTPSVRDALGRRDGPLEGTLVVTVEPRDQPDLRQATRVALRVEIVEQPRPALHGVQTSTIAPGGVVLATGADLLDGDEGQSTLLLSGTFTTDEAGAAIRDVERAVLPLRARSGRTEGEFVLSAGPFGLRPGRFEGHATLRTTLADGRVYESARLDGLELEQREIALEAPPPLSLARGQVLTLRAHGALPWDAVAQTASLLVIEGRFTPRSGGDAQEVAGPTAWRWAPEDVPTDDQVRIAMRTQLGPSDVAPAKTTPIGPGAAPGRLIGTARLQVRSGREVVSSPPVPIDLTLAPMTQAVHVDFTEGFVEGLVLFGLADAAEAVRARVLEVCRRDFAGLRVHFYEAPPTDWLEFTTVELGGRDPNGVGLLGLESSSTKDEGNRRLDERLGGQNARTAEAGAPAFGGVFVSSFLKFSPGAIDAATIADPAFDALFAPFSPELGGGGQPFDPDVDVAGTPRGRQAAAAARALGNLLGGTVTHELGHAFGLSAVAGRVHNPGDWPGDLMDRGDARPFAERAEIDGTPPGRFTSVNAESLRRLLGDP